MCPLACLVRWWDQLGSRLFQTSVGDQPISLLVDDVNTDSITVVKEPSEQTKKLMKQMTYHNAPLTRSVAPKTGSCLFVPEYLFPPSTTGK